MKAVQVDERDAGWEAGDPTFKVILFHEQGTWAVDTWDLSDCGVLDAIRWAQDHVRPSGAWAIGLVDTRHDLAVDDGPGFTYLEGFDLNVSPADLSPWERQQVDSMLRRRATRVVNGEPD